MRWVILVLWISMQAWGDERASHAAIESPATPRPTNNTAESDSDTVSRAQRVAGNAQRLEKALAEAKKDRKSLSEKLILPGGGGQQLVELLQKEGSDVTDWLGTTNAKLIQDARNQLKYEGGIQTAWLGGAPLQKLLATMKDPKTLTQEQKGAKAYLDKLYENDEYTRKMTDALSKLTGQNFRYGIIALLRDLDAAHGPELKDAARDVGGWLRQNMDPKKQAELKKVLEAYPNEKAAQRLLTGLNVISQPPQQESQRLLTAAGDADGFTALFKTAWQEHVKVIKDFNQWKNEAFANGQVNFALVEKIKNDPRWDLKNMGWASSTGDMRDALLAGLKPEAGGKYGPNSTWERPETYDWSKNQMSPGVTLTSGDQMKQYFLQISAAATGSKRTDTSSDRNSFGWLTSTSPHVADATPPHAPEREAVNKATASTQTLTPMQSFINDRINDAKAGSTSILPDGTPSCPTCVDGAVKEIKKLLKENPSAIGSLKIPRWLYKRVVGP